jgi:beta-galactosidase
LKRDSAGNPFYAYGGDFGEKLHDGNFCINGIVASDGRPKAAIEECKRVFQPVEFLMTDTASVSIKIRNRHAVLSLERYTITAELRENGVLKHSFIMPSLKIQPGNDTIVSLRSSLPALSANKEYHLSLIFALKEQEQWAPAGHRIASEQWKISSGGMRPHAILSKDPIAIEESSERISVRGNDFSATILQKEWCSIVLHQPRQRTSSSTAASEIHPSDDGQ